MKTMIVAEMSANHNGSLATAKDTIRAIANSGADAVKLQTYTPDSLTLNVKKDDFLLKGGLWDGRYLYDLYREAMTPYEWHQELYDLAKECGLICFSTPFDIEGVDLLKSLNNPIYKIASFEIAHHDLIRYAAREGKPMVLSSGIASARELEEAVRICREENNNDITILKCTSAYPARIEDASLYTMREIADKYGVKVGLSDHSPGSFLPALSVAFGAAMIEKHFIIDRSIGGADAPFSMDATEFEKMVKDVRLAEAAIGMPGKLPEDEDPNRGGRKWGRSLYVSNPINAGEEFSDANVACVRPGYSLHPRYKDELMGRRAKKCYQKGDRIDEEELK